MTRSFKHEVFILSVKFRIVFYLFNRKEREVYAKKTKEFFWSAMKALRRTIIIFLGVLSVFVVKTTRRVCFGNFYTI